MAFGSCRRWRASLLSDNNKKIQFGVAEKRSRRSLITWGRCSARLPIAFEFYRIQGDSLRCPLDCLSIRSGSWFTDCSRWIVTIVVWLRLNRPSACGSGVGAAPCRRFGRACSLRSQSRCLDRTLPFRRLQTTGCGCRCGRGTSGRG